MVVRQLITLPSQLQLLDRLQHHIYLSSSVIFVSGEQGSGKSTILEQLANKLPDDVQEAFIQLKEPLLEPQIRQQIITQLYNDPLFDAQDSLFSSVLLLQEKQQIEAPRLIILDNAQFLSPQLLTELTELVAQKERLGINEINVLLLAPEENNLQMFSAANQVCACLEFKLDALDRNEASNLLNHVFKQAGYLHQIENQDAILKQLNICQGTPQKIIELGDQIVAGKLINNDASWFRTRLPAIALMFLLLIVAGGLASYLYPLFIKQSPKIMVANKKPIDKKLIKTIDMTLPTSNALTTKSKQSDLVESVAANWNEKPRPNIEENSLQVGLHNKEKKEIKIVTTAKTENATQINESLEEKPSEEKVDVQDNQKLQDIQNKEVLTVKNLTEKKEIVIDQNVEQQAKVILPIENKKSEKKIDSIFTKKSELLSISPSHYTLQLAGMASEVTLQRFISTYGRPKGNLHIYQSIRNNKPWYVVIFGDYNTHNAAEKASKALPASLANLDSWIKKYELVHQDLQLNNE